MKQLLLYCFLISLAVPVMAQRSKKRNIVKKEENFICYYPVSPEAYFPGREAGWLYFLEKHLNLNSVLEQNEIDAGCQTVQVQFIINRDGSLYNFKVENADSVHPALAAETLRVVRLSPKWRPAVQSGCNVKVYRRQNISFCIEPEDTLVLPARFSAGEAAVQSWFNSQLNEAFLQQSCDSLPAYKGPVTLRFILKKGGAQKISITPPNLDARLEREIQRLVATPGLWLPAPEQQHAAAERRYIIYTCTFECVLENPAGLSNL
jgi:hypothetical protein